MLYQFDRKVECSKAEFVKVKMEGEVELVGVGDESEGGKKIDINREERRGEGQGIRDKVYGTGDKGQGSRG